MSSHSLLNIWIALNVLNLETLTSDIVACDKHLSCVNKSLTNVSYVYVRAYQGAIGPFTSLSSNASCSGSYSCYNMQFIHPKGPRFRCFGSYACANTTITSSTTTIHCWGTNSCTYSAVTSTATSALDCGGYESCANTYIDNVSTIDAKGAYSLYQSIIDTINIPHNLTIRLSGHYAAYDAKLICRSHNICHIYCYGNTSCDMLSIDCVGTCFIHHPVHSTYSIRNSQHTIEATSIVTHDTMSDELCVGSSVIFNEYQQRTDAIINDDQYESICCRGDRACVSIDINTNIHLLCTGGYSCSAAYIIGNVNGAVYCDGGFACFESKMTHSKWVHCTGSYSCQEAIITRSRNIICSAHRSCSFAQMVSSGGDMNIYFFGYQSGDDCDIHCAEGDICNIICSGGDSCGDTRLYCIGICNVTYNILSGRPIYMEIGVKSEDTNDIWIYVVVSILGVFVVIVLCLCIYKRVIMTERSYDEIDEAAVIAPNVEPGIISFSSKEMEGENNREFVRIWLESTVGLAQYFSLFMENGYDSMDFISEISTINQLQDIGVNLKGHQTKLLAEIQRLKEVKDEQNTGGNVYDDSSEGDNKRIKYERKESGDSDDMYVEENMNEKDVHIETTNRSKGENDQKQETQGDMYYDKANDDIWKREVNIE